MSDTPRVVPHSLEAERAVLGGIIVSNASYDAAASVLTAAMFFRAVHRKIYTAITTLVLRDEPIDFVTLKTELERVGQLDDVGGPSYLAGLTDGVPSSSNVRHYAEIVREKFLLRELISGAKTQEDAAYGVESTSSTIIRESEQRLFKLSGQAGGTSRMMSGADAVKMLFADMEAAEARKGTLLGFPTGFASFDELTLGWQPGDLVVMAAHSNMGKTILALNSAVAMAKAGHQARVFSLEMTAPQLWRRLLSAESGVALDRIKRATWSAHELKTKIAPANEVIHGLPLAIDDTPARTALSIRNQCRQMHMETGLAVAVVDFAQLITPSDAEDELRRDQQIGAAAKMFKTTAKELGMVFILLSQLNRASERRTNQRPELSDLRESGQLGEYADTVVFIHRTDAQKGGLTEAIFRKMRDGNGGTLKLTLERECVRFLDGCEEAEPAEGPAPKQKKFASPDRW